MLNTFSIKPRLVHPFALALALLLCGGLLPSGAWAQKPAASAPAAGASAPVTTVDDDAADKAREALRVTNSDADIQQRTYNEAAQAAALSDKRIAAAVSIAMARAPAIPDVTVDVNAGVVTLTGTVPDDKVRARATRLAKGVKDVREVDNQLKLSMDLTTRWASVMEETKDKTLRLIGGLPLLAVALVVLWLGWWLGRFLGDRLTLLRMEAHNPYLKALAQNAVRWAFTLGGLLIALDLLGATTVVGAVVGSAGVMGLAVGFAFRDIAENYIAGIMLSLRRPFAPGDHVVIDGKEGRVVSLTARTTILMTLDGNHLSLPNAMVFKATVMNHTLNPRRRFEFDVDVDGSESIRQSREAGLAAIQQINGVLADPAASCIVREFGSKGFVLRFYGWVDQRETDFGRTRSECIRAVKAAFGRAQIDLARNVQFVVPQPPPDTGEVVAEPLTQMEDTRVNTDMDAQLKKAQQQHADGNLIGSEPPASAPRDETSAG